MTIEYERAMRRRTRRRIRLEVEKRRTEQAYAATSKRQVQNPPMRGSSTSDSAIEVHD